MLEVNKMCYMIKIINDRIKENNEWKLKNILIKKINICHLHKYIYISIAHK